MVKRKFKLDGTLDRRQFFPPPPAPKGNKYAVGHRGRDPDIWTKEQIEIEAEELEKWMQLEDSIYLKCFAIERGYSPEYLTRFAKSNPVFAQVFKRVKDWQEAKLIKYALFKKTDSSFTKFLLAVHHGMYETTKVHHTTDNNGIKVVLEHAAGTSEDLKCKE